MLDQNPTPQGSGVEKAVEELAKRAFKAWYSAQRIDPGTWEEKAATDFGETFREEAREALAVIQPFLAQPDLSAIFGELREDDEAISRIARAINTATISDAPSHPRARVALDAIFAYFVASSPQPEKSGDGKTDCETCGGAGRLPSKDPADDPDCPDCKGTGKSTRAAPQNTNGEELSDEVSYCHVCGYVGEPELTGCPNDGAQMQRVKSAPPQLSDEDRERVLRIAGDLEHWTPLTQPEWSADAAFLRKLASTQRERSER